jgi:hypothetical protein
MGDSHFAHWLQGGGVYVTSGTVTITSSSIASNTASGDVRAFAFKSSHRPDGKIADTLTSTHACTTAADALVKYRMYVPQRPSMFPIAPMGRWLTCPNRLSSIRDMYVPATPAKLHRPDGKVADVLAPTHVCTTAADAPVNYTSRLYVPQRPSMFPIAPMGDSRFARCLQGGGVYVNGGSVSVVNSQIYSNTALFVRTHLQKFPSPRWESC